MARLTTEQIVDRSKALLADANNVLKASGCKLRIEVKGSSLVLRGVLPPRTSDRSEPYRQRLSLGMKLSPAAITQAQSLAQRISFDVDMGRFDWANYSDGDTASNDKTCEQWIKDFAADHLDSIKPNTWIRSYLYYFDKLPQDEILTDNLLTKTYSTIPNSKKRSKQLCAMAYQKLAKFAGIELNLTKVRKAKSDLSKRNIPSDDEIVDFYSKIPNLQWQYAYGLLATYGFRPHELSFLDLKEFPVIRVTEGKTGERRVYPIPAEWVDVFNLSKGVLPDVTYFGNVTSMQFKRYDCPFTPYDLRHAYAIRGTITKKIQTPIMARLMGHSTTVHLNTYNAWIKDSQVDSEMMVLTQSLSPTPQPALTIIATPLME
jgi:integrase